MNHRPFEDWLLNEQHLNPAEKRELDAHLRTCKQCAALAETGLELRSIRQVAPAPGFTMRFHKRLAAQRIADRRRRLWGVIVFLVGGVGLLLWLISPFLLALIDSPAQWITIVIGYMLFIVTSIQTMADVALVFLRVVPAFIPPYVWMVFVSAMAGFGLLWTVSIWRFSRLPRGV
jgi:anti-sigma factor RsiW